MGIHPFKCTDLTYCFSYFSGEDYLSLGANVGRAEIPMQQNPEGRGALSISRQRREETPDRTRFPPKDHRVQLLAF